ncbi:methionine--tRNA ligase [bacterium]|nr:MAG: methionine--tRNA ligase [bacterium]
MKKDFKRILVTSALPYANGPSHIGRLTGAYLPADIYVRYQRMMKRDIVYICGSDEHGVPITIQAEKEGVTPQQLVDRYNAMIQDEFFKMGISFDHYSRTSSFIHRETAQEFFLDLLGKAILRKKPEMQWYDETAKMYLSDRYVEGTCPICRNTDARGDQCEKCGTYLNQMQLIDPRSKVSGSTPVAKETTHWYMPLGDFQPELEKWIGSKTHWKDNVINYCKGWFNQKLADRAITRDLDWGVPLPQQDNNGKPIEGVSGKVLYVWFEAVLGYISSTKEWAQKIGNPSKWKEYWQQEDTKLVHFIGKDNIVFHAIMFPAIMMAYNKNKSVDRFVLVSEIPACEFLNLEGAKLSTSRNYAVWVKDYLEKFPPDPLRYTLTSNLPENKDSDFSWKDFQAKNNNELADILGNFVNRSLAFTIKNFDGKVPAPGTFSEMDNEMLSEIYRAQAEVGEFIEDFKFRDACRRFMDLARNANKYFNDSEPWKTLKSDRVKCQNTLYVSVQIVKALAVIMHPFMPFTSEKAWKMLNMKEQVAGQNWNQVSENRVSAGHILGNVEILFTKIEDDMILKETNALNQITEHKGSDKSEPSKMQPLSAPIDIDDFAKVDMRSATVLQCEKIEGTSKLLKLQLDLGGEKRQVVSGLAEYYKPDELIGKQVIIVANLKPAKIRGVESNGMILTVGDGQNLKILMPENLIASGSKVS